VYLTHLTLSFALFDQPFFSILNSILCLHLHLALNRYPANVENMVNSY